MTEGDAEAPADASESPSAAVVSTDRLRAILVSDNSALLDTSPEPSTALAPTGSSALALASLASDAASARDYAAAARSENTLKAYRGDLKAFVAWCASRDVVPMPAEAKVVALYLAHLADAKRAPAGIDRALTAIAQAHRLAGHPSPRLDPVVQAVRSGIRRTLGVAQRTKAPMLVDALRLAVAATAKGPAGARDRALLLVGFAGGFRRSELVALAVADMLFTTEGLELLIRRSKTDQEGAGRRVGIPLGHDAVTCPVQAMRAWLRAGGIVEGPVFRSVSRHGRVSDKVLSGRDVARVVKRAAAAAGLDPAVFSGHSLRAGLATAAAKAGKSERAIMKQTGHKSSAMVRRYIRDAELFADNAAEDIGL